jgi:hypothetical protein
MVSQAEAASIVDAISSGIGAQKAPFEAVARKSGGRDVTN